MSSNLAPGLARKLRKVLETRTDSPELLASLTTLSSFYDENTLQSRRNLRSTIEKRGLSINEEFLRASEAAQKVKFVVLALRSGVQAYPRSQWEAALDAVDQEVSGLADCCDRIAKSLTNCSASTGDIVMETERLKQELETTTQRQEIISNFLHSYQLSPEEVHALRDEDLNENFFKALARVQEIHSNCKVLLRTHHQRAGLELMDMMAVYQEGAYEQLCRWVQAECRSLGDNDIPEVNDLLKIAARSLRERPVLFKYCAEEVASTRHNALFRRFISALTRGGPGGMPRPIEVHAHDPLRYVGDMLAWLHQALASERELATALFSSDVNASMDSTSQRFTLDSSKLASKPSQFFKDQEKEEGKVEADMTFVLDRIFEGVCRPFKVRVEQVLQSQPGLTLSYKLSNLLEFYSYTISELLGQGAALSVTVRDVKDAAERTFFDILKARGEKLLRYPSLVAVDLSPPPAVAEGVSVLLELLDNYMKMMVPAGKEKPGFERVLSAVIDPLVQMCERAAEAYAVKSPLTGVRRISTAVPEIGRGLPAQLPSPSRTTSADTLLGSNFALRAQGVSAARRIFLVNCLSAIQQPLVGSVVAWNCVTSLGSAIEGHIADLVEQEVGAILEKCGLQKKVAYIKERSGKGEIVPKEEEMDNERPMAEIEGMSPTAVSDSLKVFLGLLAGTEGGPLPEFEQMQVPRLRSEAANQVARALADGYESIYLAVMDPVNCYPDPKSMLRHTPDQIRTILGV